MKEGDKHYNEKKEGLELLLELIEVLQGAYFPPGRVADLHEAHKCFGIFSEGKDIEKEEKHPSRSYIMARVVALPLRVRLLPILPAGCRIKLRG